MAFIEFATVNEPPTLTPPPVTNEKLDVTVPVPVIVGAEPIYITLATPNVAFVVIVDVVELYE